MKTLIKIVLFGILLFIIWHNYSVSRFEEKLFKDGTDDEIIKYCLVTYGAETKDTMPSVCYKIIY